MKYDVRQHTIPLIFLNILMKINYSYDIVCSLYEQLYKRKKIEISNLIILLRKT